ncbi:MAG: hypothetical protein U9N46_00235, partial [Euryarchaeota archaeon]|nr:hypothetical protein [Euryarchaeota archaeon]
LRVSAPLRPCVKLENNNAKVQRRDGAKNKSPRVYFTGIFGCAQFPQSGNRCRACRLNIDPLYRCQITLRRNDPPLETKIASPPDSLITRSVFAAFTGSRIRIAAAIVS